MAVAETTSFLSGDRLVAAEKPIFYDAGNDRFLDIGADPTQVPTINAGFAFDQVNSVFKGVDTAVGLRFTSQAFTMSFTFNSTLATGLLEANLGRYFAEQSVTNKYLREVIANDTTKLLDTGTNTLGTGLTLADLSNVRTAYKLKNGVLIPVTPVTTAPNAGEVQLEDTPNGIAANFFAADATKANARKLLVYADTPAQTQLADTDTSLLALPFEFSCNILANSGRILQIESVNALMQCDGDVASDGTVTVNVLFGADEFNCGRAATLKILPDNQRYEATC